MSRLFDRAGSDWKPLLEEARTHLPPKVEQAVSLRFMCGIHPHFAGLHYFETGVSWYSYGDTAHACFAAHSSDGMPRVVLPTLRGYPDPVRTVIHEVGHLFDEATGFTLDAPETTPYSEKDRFERVAEAFKIMLCPPSGAWREYTEQEAFRPLREEVFGCA